MYRPNRTVFFIKIEKASYKIRCKKCMTQCPTVSTKTVVYTLIKFFLLCQLALTCVCTAATPGPDLSVNDSSPSILETVVTAFQNINEALTATPSTAHVTTLPFATSSQSRERNDLTTVNSFGSTNVITDSITEKQRRGPLTPDVQLNTQSVLTNDLSHTKSVVTDDFSHILENETNVTGNGSGSSDHGEKDDARKYFLEDKMSHRTQVSYSEQRNSS